MRQIGEILKKRREERKLKIDDVKADTFISKKYIVALEEGRIDGFPAEVYYLGFLKRYAVYLKLNPDELISMYYSSVKQNAETKNQLNSVRGAGNQRLLRVMAYTIAICGVTAIFLLLVLTHKKNGADEAEKARAAKASATVVAVTPAPVPVKRIPLTLGVKAFKNSWIKVVTDDVTAFEGIIVADASQEWTAQHRIRLLIGNTKGINASLNGKPIDMSKYNEPGTQELNFTARNNNPGK
jgi:cytoskeletal protein RodZ